MRIRFMTFNVQHFHPYTDAGWETIDLPAFAEAIRCFSPDILTLNEVRGEGPSKDYGGQTAALAGELGYYAFFAPAFIVPGRNGPAGPYGNAILSRFPLLDPEIVPIPAVILPNMSKTGPAAATMAAIRIISWRWPASRAMNRSSSSFAPSIRLSAPRWP